MTLQNSTSSPHQKWLVLHLPYPREKQEYPRLLFHWKRWRSWKFPFIKIEKQLLEKKQGRIHHSLLCEKLQELLNDPLHHEYELFSVTPTQTGDFFMTPHHYGGPAFLKSKLQGKIQSYEALIIILRKKS